MDRDLFTFYKAALEGKFTTPLCSEYKSAWRKCGDDKEMLVKLALKQQSLPYFSTACYKNLGLTKEYILEEFGDYINGKKVFNDVEGVSGYTYELYVGYDEPITVRTDVLSLMWHNGDVSIPNTKCPVVYISNHSDVHLTLDGFNSPRIYVFDDSKVTIDECDENSSVLIYRYSDKSVVTEGRYCFGKIKTFQKELRL